jgi:hypothetical protein
VSSFLYYVWFRVKNRGYFDVRLKARYISQNSQLVWFRHLWTNKDMDQVGSKTRWTAGGFQTTHNFIGKLIPQMSHSIDTDTLFNDL